MIPILFDLEPSVDKYWLNNILSAVHSDRNVN